jgi:hypothetical protein
MLKHLAVICLFLSVAEGVQAANLGEINVYFGSDLVSKTDVKNVGSNNLKYGGYVPNGNNESSGLTDLRSLGDNSQVDGYWGHRNNVIIGFDYMHSLSSSEDTILNKIKVGIGTKLVEKKIMVTHIAYLQKNPTPPAHANGNSTGAFYVSPIDKRLFTDDADFWDDLNRVSPRPFRELYLLPVYFSAQINPINALSSIYFKGNIGYSFVVKDDMPEIDGYADSSLWKFKREGGLYFGVEIGNEFKLSEKTCVLLSLFYDYLEYTTSQSEDGMAHDHLKAGWFTNVDHSFGLKTGLKFRL